jgi:hypothetical protein
MSFQEQNPALNDRSDWIFVEVWVEVALNPPPMLQLIHLQNGEYRILNPRKNYAVEFSTTSYDEATFWLAEDEYERFGSKLYNEYLE